MHCAVFKHYQLVTYLSMRFLLRQHVLVYNLFLDARMLSILSHDFYPYNGPVYLNTEFTMHCVRFIAYIAYVSLRTLRTFHCVHCVRFIAYIAYVSLPSRTAVASRQFISSSDCHREKRNEKRENYRPIKNQQLTDFISRNVKT